MGRQVRPQRKLPPEFSRPSGKTNKQQPVFCSHEAAAAGGSKNGIFSGTFGWGRGFSEMAETRIETMVTCHQETKGKDRGGRAGF